MPRTKQVKRSVNKRVNQSTFVASKENLAHTGTECNGTKFESKQEYESLEDLMEEMDIYYNKQVELHDKGFEKACECIRERIHEMHQNLPKSLENLALTERISESAFQDQNQDPNVRPSSQPRQSRSRKQVELFEFKKPQTPQRHNSCSRSSSRTSSRKRSASASAADPPPPKIDTLKTPAMSSRKLQLGAVITPKIYSDTPMSVMRRPLHGEVAISMSGSPLMVGAVSREDIPTVNVPLQDGRIFSIMPERGAPPEDLPYLDETTRQYLKTLRQHLEILAPRTP